MGDKKITDGYDGSSLAVQENHLGNIPQTTLADARAEAGLQVQANDRGSNIPQVKPKNRVSGWFME